MNRELSILKSMSTLTTTGSTNVTYIGAEGPLYAACEKTLGWQCSDKLIIVIWHEGWADKGNYWKDLAKAIAVSQGGTRTLITFFGDTMEDFQEKEGGHMLPLLFRLLGRDPNIRSGCCPITDFERLGRSLLPFDPNDPETALILRANKILGLNPI